MPPASCMLLDVYCSNEELQEGMQQRFQAEPLDGIQLRWQPVLSGREATETAQHTPSLTAPVSSTAPVEDTAPHEQSSSFDGQRYMTALNKQGRMGQVLMTAREMTSTQEFMRAHLPSLGDGVVLVADRQTSGKGRGGNVWTSPIGCLMFSCSRLLRVLPNQAPFINYVVCLGVVRGIQDAVRRCCGPDTPSLPIAIKWPNDIYYMPPPRMPSPGAGSSGAEAAQGVGEEADASGVWSGPECEHGVRTSAPGTADKGGDGPAEDWGVSASAAGQAGPKGRGVGADSAPGPSSVTGGPQKIGGALIHTTWSRDQFNVVTGIGLNLSNPHPTTCLNAILRHSCSQQGSRGPRAWAAGRAEAAGGPAAAPSSSRDAASSCAAAGSGGAPKGPSGQDLLQETLLAHVMNRLDEYFQVFEKFGFGPLQADYLASWLHSGQQVRFLEHDDRSIAAAPASLSEGHQQQEQGVGSAARPLTSLTIQGLSPSGFLLAVEKGSGRQYELTPDGNSLDMMAGLIRRKL